MARLAICSMLLITIIFPSLTITASTFLSLPINFASAGNYLDDQPAADLVRRKYFLLSCKHFKCFNSCIFNFFKESPRRSWKHQFNGRVVERTWIGSGGKFEKEPGTVSSVEGWEKGHGTASLVGEWEKGLGTVSSVGGWGKGHGSEASAGDWENKTD